MKKEATDRVREIYEARRTQENITTVENLDQERRDERVAAAKEEAKSLPAAATSPAVLGVYYRVDMTDETDETGLRPQQTWIEVSRHKEKAHARDEMEALIRSNPRLDGKPEYRLVRVTEEVVK